MKFEELFDKEEFIKRHIGIDSKSLKIMLNKLGYKDLENFINDTIPKKLFSKNKINFDSINENEALSVLKKIAKKNKVNKSYIGLGYYPTLLPAVIQRNVLENPGWYTSYTPYQAEVSQGRLESLLNFQQMCIDLTSLPMANSSLLDEATAACEAMAMSSRVSFLKTNKVFADSRIFPQTIDVIKTRAKYFNFDLIIGDINNIGDDDYFSVLIQYVGKEGDVIDLKDIIKAQKQKGSIITIIADIMSLVLLESPGSLGADIAVGNTQRFGVPMGFGGPHAAYFAFKEEYKRQSPGRIIGVSKDKNGKISYRMSLQTREQHIRREKATSNICTSQALLANLASMYAIYHGSEGLIKIASRIHCFASSFSSLFKKNDFISVKHKYFFDTVFIDCKDKQDIFYKKALSFNINLLKVGNNYLGISFHELSSQEDFEDLTEIFLNKRISLPEKAFFSLTDNLLRKDKFLTHSTFNKYHTEHEMLRYLKRLENKDISLTNSMIPLGSCTMKLNPTSAMLPISWDEFSQVHPFAPSDQVLGYLEMINQLKEYLIQITGFDDICFQPNAGSQGEYAGLVTIRRYNEAKGLLHKDICLIPRSAHGTNPASAQMVGFKIIIVETDAKGNVDLEDLKSKAKNHKDNLAVFMITYPSTHGVYEDNIRQICDIIHENGGQVYMDGANMNAQVGLMRASDLGADVAHFNLHKTFAIPHGGGGPGMGPIGMKSHLAKYKPKHCCVDGDTKELTAFSSAPFGSGSILSITWMYITMMGKQGLELATKIALLNANYIAFELSKDYPILYTGKNSKVAHECIIDLRPLKAQSSITETDIAKRLMDYGFHAPTVSFPVAGTLMIEPTESESKEELDRFILAMKKIKQEILMVINKDFDLQDNPLKNAPHTVYDITNWDRKYSISQAIFPTDYVKDNKFWPSVNRIDEVYGDKNLICSCPDIENYV